MPFSLNELSQKEQRTLSLLMPYWGVKADESKKRIVGALFGRSVSMNGLSDNNARKLSKLLKHTGIQLNLNKEANLKIFVEKYNHNTAPVTLKNDTATFHLKPLRNQTNDVQTWIHKRLWLPVKEPSFTVLFHSREENNIPEWLFYLIIQYYMHPLFKNLSEIKFTEFQKITASVLPEINEELAQCQLLLSHMPSQNWPQLPPKNVPINKYPVENPIHPFQERISTPSEKKFKPFGRKHVISKNHTINPFKNKNNHRSP